MNTKLTSTETKSAKPRRKYTAQFKEQALELAKRDGIPKVAKDLDIPSAMLYSWRSAQEKMGNSFEYQKMQQAETARLKREVARLQEENDFLKKAATYFAKESKQGTSS